jgi:hypothetical protein
MKTKHHILITLLLSVIVFMAFGCKKENKTQDDISIRFNESKQLTIGDNSINVTFTEVEDNRVPLSQCETSFGSRANVAISFSGTNIPLLIFGCNTDNQGNILDNTEYVDTLGYRINAYRLEPYPSTTPTNQSDYLLKIKITQL